ncbi:phosphoglycerate kinase [Candidatus Kaiserbacteria bacterium RIFCSPLOWO2_01_FULL_55_19]|uniref:Phosphoglycerate kinase n=1 Tax=Candidatus Kaiserbacteria bacterium RIFCSPLOWO2_01_FULL_55_19 TaxID=1798516 RepID=A0A1F6ESJ9_9BACT|nr:MAG: phosphoglycerate kinase [Candidatus Kaiserbacteria bacterium RIFCSPLOWO2_01_FULL_55_19]
MRSIRDIPVFTNIPILVRTSLNVPFANGSIANDYRLERALPTIRYLCERGARVVLISHLGEQGTESLAPVASAFGKLIKNVSFCPTTIGEGARAAVRALLPGHILILENLRRNAGEKKNDPSFARELAGLADVFVQDSFDTCHRGHASIIGVPNYLPSYAGLLLEEEVRELSRALTPVHPSLAVIGGAKFSTKEAVLMTLLQRYDHVFVGGALANDFLKGAGQEVGRSLISGTDARLVKRLLANPKLVLPIDSVVVPARLVGKMRSKSRTASFGDVRPDEAIQDQGPETAGLLAGLAHKAKTILWNGPLGRYEDGFADATDAFARAVAASRAHSIVGGGDTVASIARLDLVPRFSFVSTGGGAMLDFLAKGTLPGLQAFDKSGI